MLTDDAGTGDMDWREACDEAAATLRDALNWELPERRWEQVAATVEGMAAAVTATSLDALWQTTGQLELCSPLRVATKMGDTPRLPAPKPTLERIGELIDSLTRDGDLKPGDGSGRDSQARA